MMISRMSPLPRMKSLLPIYTELFLKTSPINVARHSTAAAQLAEKKLPCLPVPKLQNTIEKYLKTVEPFLSPAEYAVTAQKARLFASPGGEGQRYQEMLEKRAACMPNWLEDLWLSTAYLGYRDSVVVNSSPSLMLPPQRFKDESERLMYTAKLIVGALQFSKRVYRNEIPQQIIGGAPQDMTQFHRILGTVRKPDLPQDQIIFGDRDNMPGHIVVVRNNNYFKLPVTDNRGNILSEEEILFMLRNVLDNSSEQGPPVGILTAAHRDTWAKAYSLLNCPTLRENCSSVSWIESCLFLVCLDNSVPPRGHDRRTSIALQLLHGCGSNHNSANRWFDKTIQFIVGEGGEVGLCYEHTPAEGIPVSMMVDDILKYLKESATKICTEVQCPRPIPLPFQIDVPIECAIQDAAKQLNAIVADLDLYVLGFEDYGKEVPKKFKLSPDCYIQMAMQLAYFRIHCKPPPTYESASTRMFTGGRTETIRSCSTESKKFCEVMLDRCSSARDKAELLRNAVARHRDYTNEAMRGMGVDRHLLGLKLMADSCGGTLPEIFRDRAYAYSRAFLISSSQVGAPNECVMSYGPSEKDGYAVCYNPLPSKIIFSVATSNSCSSTSAEKYAESLTQSLREMQTCLEETTPQKSKL